MVYDNFDEILLDIYRNTLIHRHLNKQHTNLHLDHLFDYFYLFKGEKKPKFYTNNF